MPGLLDSCRNEHPSASTNRFGVFGGGSSSQQETYGITKEGLQLDLANERPTWILSAYAPTKDSPEQLWGGADVEQSPEEARVYYYTGVAAGNPQKAIDDVNNVYQAAEAKMQAALSNPDAVLQYMRDAVNKHPNRVDIVKQSCTTATNGTFARDRQQSTPFGGQPTSAFGAPSTSTATTGAFGQPSALGQQSRPFGGTSAFGQPSQPAASSGFGQPSQLGTGGSAFGQPSQPGSGGSAFGQTSGLGQKPNPFGGGGAFGQPSQPAAGATSAFGQPSQPGTTSAFGQPSQLGGGGAFGQPAALGQKPNPFGGGSTGGSPFASAAAAPSPFSAPSAPAASAGTGIFGKPAATTSPFAAPAAASNPFGAKPDQAMDTSQPATPSAFGQPTPAPATTAPVASPFGQPSQLGGGGGFGQPAALGQKPNPFGSGGFGAATPANPAPTAAPAAAPAGSANGPYGPNATRQHPLRSSYMTIGPDNRLIQFKGRNVTMQKPEKNEPAFPAVQNGDKFMRIWMPEGPPLYYKDTELGAEEYNDQETIDAYKHLVERGSFKDGKMPMKPPKREWCLWDF